MSGSEGPQKPKGSPFNFFGEVWRRMKEVGLVDQNVRMIHSIVTERARRLHETLGFEEGIFPAIGAADGKLYDSFVTARKNNAISETEAPKYIVLRTIHDELKATETIWNEGVLHYRTESMTVLDKKLKDLKSKVVGYADLIAMADEIMRPMNDAMAEILVTLLDAQDTLRGLISRIPNSPVGRELDEYLLTIEQAIERLKTLKR